MQNRTKVLIDTNVIIDALASTVSDYEDAVVERVSVKADMDYILTRNVKDYQQGMVKAILAPLPPR